MRILLAVNNPSAHLFPLPNGWADRGHTVDILMDSSDGRFGHAREYVHPGIRLLTLLGDGTILDAVNGEPKRLRLRELLQSSEAVVVGGYATRVAQQVVCSRGSSGARFVLLAERPLPRGVGPRLWLRDSWAKWLIRQVDAVWSMSTAGDLAFARLGRVPEAHIPYPIAIPPRSSDYTTTTTEKWSAKGPLQTVVLGQLIERKRPLAALQALRTLRDSGLTINAQIVGSGPLEAAVTGAAQGLPVTFHGHVPAHLVGRILQESHFLIHPASHDGWGMAVVEAASRGVPVVATAGCDAATELAARTSGVRITDGSASEMARAAKELADDFRSDPVHRSLELIGAVEEVCGVDRIVERSLDAMHSRGVNRG